MDLKRGIAVESILTDDVFLRIVKDPAKTPDECLRMLYERYPGSEKSVLEAFRAVTALRIHGPEIPDGQIDRSLRTLLDRIRRRRRRRMAGVLSGVAAATVVCVLLLLLRFTTPDDPVGRMLNEMAGAPVFADSIELSVGGGRSFRLADNAAVVQHADGSLETAGREKIQPREIEYVQINVPYGKRGYLEFGDGTRAWINSGSQVVYPAVFDRKQREILVSGEVYLEVSPEAERPFIVRTGSLDIRVLGTAFNVTAYADDPATRVVLVEGSVEAGRRGERERVAIRPGECLSCADGQIDVRPVDVRDYIGWKDGYMTLNGDTLGEIFHRLSRYYRVDFRFSEDFSRTRFLGKLELADDWQQVLGHIALVRPLAYQLEDDDKIYVQFNEF